MRVQSFWFVVIMMTAATVLADDNSLHYNLYHLNVTAEQEVANDTLTVNLSASHQAPQAAEAAKVVNERMQAAIKQAKKVSTVKAQTGNYRTHAVYKNQRIIAWRAVQQLQLKSQDFTALSELVGQLQEALQAGAMQFSVSAEARDKITDTLTREALSKFQARGALVQSTMKARQYEVVTVNIGEQGYQPPLQGGRLHREMAVMTADVPAPTLEAGTSKIIVSVSGQIQLVY